MKKVCIYKFKKQQERFPMKTINKIFLFILTVGILSCKGQREYNLHPGLNDFNHAIRYSSKLDLLWVIDNSQSMKKHQKSLKRQLGDFIDLLHEKRVDYRIGVTTTDVGLEGEKGVFVGNPPVLYPGVRNVKRRFLESVLVGESGSEVERGLEAMHRALSRGRLVRENSGFFREDAFLAVVFMSNEDDQSANTVEYYADFLNRAKGINQSNGSLNWMSYYVGIVNSQGCNSKRDHTSPGDRYIKLAALSGGLSESICRGHMAEALQNVRDSVVQKVTSLTLEAWPLMGTLQVLVNNREVPEDRNHGWSYEHEFNRIVFHGDGIPRDGSMIRIHYQPLNANRYEDPNSHPNLGDWRGSGRVPEDYHNNREFYDLRRHSNDQRGREYYNNVQQNPRGNVRPNDRSSYGIQHGQSYYNQQPNHRRNANPNDRNSYGIQQRRGHIQNNEQPHY